MTGPETVSSSSRLKVGEASVAASVALDPKSRGTWGPGKAEHNLREREAPYLCRFGHGLGLAAEATVEKKESP